MRASFLLLIACSCIGTDTTSCPASTMRCRAGTVCLQLAPDEALCVQADQFPPCDGAPDATGCDLDVDGTIDGTCYGGACLPAVCGNGRLDSTETCDDGGNLAGDGCSADCGSLELCGNSIVDPVRLENDVLIPDEECDDGDSLGHDGCSSTCRRETARWNQVHDEEPVPRGGAAMVYDASRGRIVLFGGTRPGSTQSVDTEDTFNDTWAWDGGWKPIEVDLPPQERVGHAMAYDPKRQQTVLFGGARGNPLEETWIFEGDRWTELTPATRPSARSGHAMAYHPSLGVVLFGGTASTGLLPDDTWVWDGTTWEVLPVPTKPPGREGHSMTFDPARGVIVMHGGVATETWELDGLIWRKRAPGPSATDVILGFDPIQRRVILFGGNTPAGSKDETWSWDGTVWTQLNPIAPPRRAGAGMANDPITGELIMFGGINQSDPQCLSCPDTALGDTWRWAGNSWRAQVRASPGARSGHVAALDIARGRVVMFGGAERFDTKLADTWEFDGVSWVAGGTGPGARSDAAMAFDSVRSRTVLFGGQGALNNMLADTWTWDGFGWTQRAVATQPPARAGHAMAFDVARGRLVLFGGDSGPPMADTWEWDDMMWTDVSPLGTGSPSPRSGAALAYDPIRQRVLLFGGRAADDSRLDDTWSWDGSTWIELHPLKSPPRRDGAAMAWDGQRRRVVLFGGGVTSGNDTWEWDGTTWRYVPAPTSPAPRSQHTLVPAPDGSGMLVFGGRRVDPLAEHWILQRDSDDSYQTCRTPLDDDGDLLVGCADGDCWPRCAPTCPPGAPCAPNAPRCGDSVCNPALESCRMCPECACAVRCGDWACDTGETRATCPGDCP